MIPNPIPAFLPLTGIYEPSAIQQLPDGRFLVVEDEKQHPFTLLTIDPDGKVSSEPLRPGFFESDTFWKLDDLEGLALDPSGNLYAITSHSRDGEGDEKKSRDKLARFRIEDDDVVEQRVVTTLKPALRAAHPVLAAAAEIRDVKAQGGLNIEALEFSPDPRRLFIGLRSPLLDHRAIIACIENPAARLEDDAEDDVEDNVEDNAPPPIAADLITLDLLGQGIRGMAYVDTLGGYLVISGPVDREQVDFRLWFWSGHAGAAARRVEIPGLQGLEHAEGVSAAIIDGQARIILVSDDGNRKEGRYARFLLLDPGQLRIAA